MGWALVDPSLTPDPITGRCVDYLAAARRLGERSAAVAQAAEQISHLHRRLAAGPWRSRAAAPLGEQLAGIAAAARSAGCALGDAADACRRHADALDELRSEGAQALEVALGWHEELRWADRSLEQARRALAAADGALAADMSPTTVADVDLYRSQVRSAERRVNHLQLNLCTAVTRHRALVDEEARWSRATAAAIGAAADRLVSPPPVVPDLGGTYESTWRGAWETRPDASAAVRGAATVIEALELTATPTQLAADEFGLIELAGGKYVVVLPGVTDLSRPHLGLDPRHRTVRDLDQHAVRSAHSVGVAGNRYAAFVAEGLARFGVAPGSELLIVGHSFGADTALDLAADPIFRNEYRVTHVVAAGYHSAPQLPDVPSTTQVLVLENARDAVVEFERLGEHPLDAVYDARAAWGDLRDGDPVGAVGAATGVGAAITRFGGYVLGASNGRRRPARVSSPTPQQVLAVFDGGEDGAGHHPRNYAEYLGARAHPAVAAFAADLAAQGYAAGGHHYAIDVSVPEPRAGSW